MDHQAPDHAHPMASPAPTAALETLLGELAEDAVARDKRGGTALGPRALIRKSGLLTLSIPLELGGQGADWPTVFRVVRRIAEVDGSMAHVFGFHHLLLATCRLFGGRSQWTESFRRTVEDGWFWGNALNPKDRRTRATRVDGGYVFRGDKSFCSGARDADRLVVSAFDASERLLVAVIPPTRSGLVVHDDWDCFGQRQTDSGSVTFEDVTVHDAEVLSDPGPMSSPRATLRSLIAQSLLAHLYLGIGRGALAEGRRHARERSAVRPSSTASGADPYVLLHFGDMWLELEAADALCERASRALQQAWDRGDALTADERGQVAVAVAAAKVATTRASLETTSRFFEATGAGTTAGRLGLDRFWRNARVHTLHDPVDHKRRDLGAFALSGDLPLPSFYS